MAISYCVLASGSRGNCLWVRGGGVEVLVDCGLSAAQIGRRLAEVGGDLANVQAVVCTHGHGDHVAGAAVLGRRHGLTVYGTSGTHEAIRAAKLDPKRASLPMRGQVAIGGLTVHTVPTMHDAPGSVALVLADDETRLGIVTDLGIVTEAVARTLGGVDGLVLEMNHDEEMLLYGPYPEVLKKRIKSEVGHLSNRQGAALLARLCHPGLQHVTLAHLSEQNNTPGKARAAAEAALEVAGYTPRLEVAAQATPGAPVDLGASRQLGLPLW